MDAERFDRLLLTLTRARTRRSVLGLLAALGPTGLLAQDVAGQMCLANTKRCATGTECCSGRCVRKRGTRRKFCRAAPGQGICTRESNACVNASPACDDGGTLACVCYVTTRGFSFCGDRITGHCFACETDADCEQRPTLGQPGDRCVQCASCSDPGFNERACFHRCPNPAIP